MDAEEVENWRWRSMERRQAKHMEAERLEKTDGAFIVAMRVTLDSTVGMVS